jgi:succinate dehydrogenase/fumarate reductase flavoprotein subunit
VLACAEQAAVELGGDMLSEFIVFGIGAGALIFEYTRQSESSRRKEEALMVCICAH